SAGARGYGPQLSRGAGFSGQAGGQVGRKADSAQGRRHYSGARLGGAGRQVPEPQPTANVHVARRD
nr:hypothetical protein [Tanacetum cinerariifolium]